MNIQLITEGKKDYMDMLLLADPQEDMIEKYLGKGEMFILIDQGEVRTVCVVELLKNRKCELKNIATREGDQGKRLWKVYDPFYLRALQQPMRYHVCRYGELREVYWIL